MPGGMGTHLADIEKSCMPARHGRIPPGLEEEISPNNRITKRIMKVFLSGENDALSPKSLFQAHEVLLVRGRYGECIDPLQKITDTGGSGGRVLKLALARAGNAALDHSIPIDMDPIVSNLDLSGGIGIRRRERVKEDSLVIIESRMLASRLLEQRAMHVESDKLSTGYKEGMLRYIEMASSTAESLISFDAEIGSYHLIRCKLVDAELRLSSGDYPGAQRGFRSALDMSREMDFPYQRIRALEALGSTAEAQDEAIAFLDEAIVTARGIGNATEISRAGVSLHERKCLRYEWDPSGGKAAMGRHALLMDETAKGLQRDDPDSYIRARARAALWMARADDHRGGASVIREALKHLKRSPDDAIECELLSTAVLIHMRAGNRKKGKRALLDLIARKPVKNNPEAYFILKEAVTGQEWLRNDPDTSELFDDEIAYSIDRSAVEEIVSRAKDAFPDEFGAMLRGTTHITHIEPVLEGAGGRTSFMFSLFDRLSQRAVQGEGVVHSHPSGSARPSQADLSMFSRFPGINLIIGYPFSEDSIAAYDRLGNRVKLVIEDGS